MAQDVEAAAPGATSTSGSSKGLKDGQASGSKGGGPMHGDSRGRGQDCLLRFCRTVNAIAGLSALLCLVALAMALSTRSKDIVGNTREAGAHIQLQVLRLYGIFTALLCMLVETESEWVLSWVRALENWIGRGLMQGFLGVLTLELASNAGSASDFDRSLGVYRLVAGFAMIGSACWYLSGGLLCLGWIKTARHRKLAERARMERDIEVLDRQREELRILMESYLKE